MDRIEIKKLIVRAGCFEFEDEWKKYQSNFNEKDKQWIILNVLKEIPQDLPFVYLEEVFDLIINDGIDLNFTSEELCPPTILSMVVSKLIDKKFLLYFLEQGADINYVIFDDGDTYTCLDYLLYCIPDSEFSLERLPIPVKPDKNISIDIKSDEDILVNKQEYYEFIEVAEYFRSLDAKLRFKEMIIRFGAKKHTDLNCPF